MMRKTLCIVCDVAEPTRPFTMTSFDVWAAAVAVWDDGTSHRSLAMSSGISRGVGSCSSLATVTGSHSSRATGSCSCRAGIQ